MQMLNIVQYDPLIAVSFAFQTARFFNRSWVCRIWSCILSLLKQGKKLLFNFEVDYLQSYT